MKKVIKDFFYSILFLFVWYNAFVFMLKYFADSPYFIYDDPALWFLFFVAYYHLDDKN
jgi:hypothetical protein